MNPIAGMRKLVRMVFKRGASSIYSTVRQRVNWYRGVGDVTNSSTVAATVMWCARNFPEAPPAMWQHMGNGQLEQERDHPMLRLLQKPNPYHSGVLFWMATVTDWKTDGNAYWLKIRDQLGQVVQLWWVPSWLIIPRGSEGTYITHYEYTPNGIPLRVDPADIVHFRFGIDSDDPLRGQSPLKCVLREVFTDDEAATFTASILTNMGVPGLVVSPEQPIDKNEALEAKQSIQESYTGTRRGEPMVMLGPTKIEQFGFNPQELLLRELRRIPEERVTAALGVPAVVVGLGAGLERSTFTNMAEAREAAYESGLIPDQRIMADAVRWQLLDEFEPDPFLWEFGFDLSKVRVLQEDLYRVAQRVDLLFRGGTIMRSEARRPLGFEVVSPRDDVFMLPPRVALISGEDDHIVVTDVANTTPPPSGPSAAEILDVHRQHSRGMLELAAAVAARPAAEPQPIHVSVDPPDVHVDVSSPDVHVAAGEPPVVHNHVDVAAPDLTPLATNGHNKVIHVDYDEDGRPATYTSIGEDA